MANIGRALALFYCFSVGIGAGSETAVPQAHFLSRMKLMLKAQKQIAIGPFAQGVNRLHARVFR